jgi:hypothetical protein
MRLVWSTQAKRAALMSTIKWAECGWFHQNDQRHRDDCAISTIGVTE